MSLTSIGRRVAVTHRPVDVADVDGLTPEQRQKVKEKVEEARVGIIDKLTPWIPGDFVVTYGVLLTAWSQVRASFGWLLVVSAASAVTFVVLGAFSETGFTGDGNRLSKIGRQLFARTVAGFVVSLYAALAIPRSGWYEFAWFSRNEQSVVLTAGMAVVVLVMTLKGLQKRAVLPA